MFFLKNHFKTLQADGHCEMWGELFTKRTCTMIPVLTGACVYILLKVYIHEDADRG